MGSKHRVRDDYARARTAGEKEDRKRKILSAAADIVLGEGWQDFTMGTLARQTGVAKGTIYLYFETKSDVLDALLMEHLDAWAEKMLEACHGKMTVGEVLAKRHFPSAAKISGWLSRCYFGRIETRAMQGCRVHQNSYAI